jgi:hypothetical protein
MMVRTRTNRNFTREPLETIWPLEGSGGSGWRIVTARGGAETQEEARSRSPRNIKNSDKPLGYSGRTALRR